MRKKWGSLPTFNVPTRVDKWTDDTNPYPTFHRNEGGWLETLAEASLEGGIGFDLEFSPSTGKPHLLGIASTKTSACIPWTNGAAEMVVNVARAKNLPLVGHSVMDADKPVVESACGITTPSSLWEDSMIAGYLANQDWAAQPGKTEDDDDKGSLGLMNLWTMASYYTDVPNWKRCRGAACFGPCPDHDEPYYCGIDSWSGLMVYNEAIKSIPRPLYDDLKNLTLYCSDMSRQGIALDRELIARMETQIKEKKAGLFPSEMRLRSERCTKEKRFFLTPFNPNSSDQKIAYFKSVGIPLMGKGRQEKADKDTIRKALEQQLRKLRVSYEVDRKSSQLFLPDDDIILPEPVEYLYRLDQYMRSGKGLRSWFDDKYVAPDGLIHPRFIVTGTSTGRLASSGPNCFDAATEILTTKGWVPMPILTMSHEVAQYFEDSDTIGFTRPLTVFAKDYIGDMVQIKNQHINLRVTSDHRCPLRHRKSGKFVEHLASSYKEDWQQLGAAQTQCQQNTHGFASAEIQFLVATQADGSYTKYGIDFSFKKLRKSERLRQILSTLGWEYRDYSTKTRQRFLVTDSQAVALVDKYLGPEKRFAEWVCQLPLELLQTFCEEVFHWDGTFKTKSCYASKDKINADFVQIAFTLIGQRAKVRLYVSAEGSHSWQVDVSKHGYSLTTNVEKTVEHDTSELVYCLSVPTSYVVVRRSGRVMITGQCQNIPKRGFGALVRAAIVPRSSKLLIAKADKAQLEARIVYFYAGGKQPEIDLFTQLVVDSDGRFSAAASRNSMKERDVSKSIVHGYHYGEGVVHLTDEELATVTRQREIKAGALLIFDGQQGRPLWEYRNGYIGFTGANLSERLFGDRTLEHRREALEIQEIYSIVRPEVRVWQQDVSRQIETTRQIVSHTGRRMRLYGTPEDDLKLALAFLGQGGGADEVQEAMLRYQSLGKIALIQVHDELVFELPREYTDQQVMKFFDVFCEPSAKFGGWRFPIEVSRGDNWCGWDDSLNPGGLRVIK
jgi:hypothetical protein